MDMRIALLIGLSLTACTPNRKKTETPKEDRIASDIMPAAQLTTLPEKNSALLGSWSACESSSSDTLKISGITHYQIKDEQTMTVSARYYSDAHCQVPFNEADASRGIKAWEQHYKETAGDDVKDYYKSLIDGFSQDSTYSASAVNAGEVGTFDQTTHFETAFLSYKILDGKLYITEACLPSEIVAASETNCNIVGESAANRSSDFANVVPFTRD